MQTHQLEQRGNRVYYVGKSSRAGAPRFAVALAANALALYVAGRLFSGVDIHGWAAYVVGAIALGFANAVFRPLLTILSLPLVIFTLGFFYLLINIATVAFAAWLAPNLSIHGFWTYVGTVVVVWLANWTVSAAIGRKRS